MLRRDRLSTHAPRYAPPESTERAIATPSIESRRYHVLGVLGEGGHGKVYRARLEASSGFTKDVAIKMLREQDPSDRLLRRFRDEARILGLLRDRAIVSVDPPIQLAGRWAVVWSAT